MFGLGAVLGGLLASLLGTSLGSKTALTLLALVDLLHWHACVK